MFFAWNEICGKVCLKHVIPFVSFCPRLEYNIELVSCCFSSSSYMFTCSNLLKIYRLWSRSKCCELIVWMFQVKKVEETGWFQSVQFFQRRRFFPLELKNHFKNKRMNDLHTHCGSVTTLSSAIFSAMNGINSMCVNYTGFYKSHHFFLHFEFINMAWNEKSVLWILEWEHDRKCIPKMNWKNPQNLVIREEKTRYR